MSAQTPFLLGSRVRLVFALVAATLIGLFLLAVLLRTGIATAVLRHSLAGQGLRSDLVVDSIGLDGGTAHGSVSQPGLDVQLGRVTVRFDRQHWLPGVAAIDIAQPRIVIDLRRGSPFKSRGGSSSLGDTAIAVSQARIIVLSEAGRIEITGNARMSGGKPQMIDAVLLPAQLHSGGFAVDIKGGRLNAEATPQGMHLRLGAKGDAMVGRSLRFHGATLDLDVPAITWSDNLKAAAGTAALSLTTERPSPWLLQAKLSAIDADLSHRRFSADVVASLKGTLPPEATKSVLDSVPLTAADRRALAQALQALSAHAHFAWSMANTRQTLRFIDGVEIAGANSLQLRLMPGVLEMNGSRMTGSLAMNLRAPGLPRFDLAMQSFSLEPSGLDASLALKGRIHVGALQDVQMDGRAVVQSRNDTLEVRLPRCAAVRIGGYGSGRTRVLSNLSGTLCPAQDRPLVSLSGKRWSVDGTAQQLSAQLPSAGLTLSRGSALFSIAGVAAEAQTGRMQLSAMASDRSKTPRLGSEKISGGVTIKAGVAQVDLALSAGRQWTPIGRIAARYHLKTGSGRATVDLPHIVFAPGGLQPSEISPLFATLAQADGSARFSGQVEWAGERISSSGRLDVEALRFSSPLGAAHRLSTHMLFTSLMPLKTAAGQRIAIDRVDWVQPLTQSAALVTLTPALLRIASTTTEVADGEVSVTPLEVPLTGDATVRGTVRIAHVSLGKLIAASNLGDKLKLEGPVSGSLPFSFGPEGLRFSNGRIDADGPGRLSINRSLWGKGESNAVEKAAYQALENLAYQSLFATVESVPGGRLRVVFHVVGYDDSPSTQPAALNLADLLTGKAFQKEIPIPRGTAINLTLDTSLNFDELLRGYQSVWSQLRASAGGHP